jgi:YbbR domain-containing protein
VGRVFADAGLKVGSLLLALVVWVVVAGEKTSEIGLAVPVELLNLPKDLEVVGDAVNAVEVRVRATPAIVRQLDSADLSLRVDLKGYEEGEHFFHLTEEAVRRPFGVTVVKLSPASITLNLERTLEREVPIQARTSGGPSAGFEIADVTCEPASVRLAGPRSRVAALRSVVTEVVSLGDARADVRKDVTIGIGDPLVRIQGSPRVHVTVKVRERHETRALSGLRLEVRGGNATARPAHVTVLVSGPSSVVGRLRPEAVVPYVELGGRPADGQRTVAVQVAPGWAGTVVERVEPAEVTIARGGARP